MRDTPKIYTSCPFSDSSTSFPDCLEAATQFHPSTYREDFNN